MGRTDAVPSPDNASVTSDDVAIAMKIGTPIAINPNRTPKRVTISMA
jgi:hypothetical protein